ncbi:MAG: KH domain-containing protein [Acidobacteria bacterium]|nr:KH domain-containing protein [Acidobacteriota bacterium]MCY4637217.1 KH domain-containing protein [Acidobacteriota bacterium]
MSRARDVVEVIAKALVDHPDSVQVDERVEHGDVRIELTTRSGDLGKLIGRRGRTASAVRALAEIAAERDGMRAAVDFLDEE